MLVLAVEGQQAAAQLPQVGDGSRPAADVGPRAPVGPDAASKHDLLCVVWQPLTHVAAERGGKRENALNVGLDGALAHDPVAGAAAEQQVERVREQRLARPGLPGDDVEAGREPQFSPLHKQQVLDAKLMQHR